MISEKSDGAEALEMGFRYKTASKHHSAISPSLRQVSPRLSGSDRDTYSKMLRTISLGVNTRSKDCKDIFPSAES